MTVDLRFYLDPATGRPHIWNHDVEAEEVEEVLANPEEDRPGRDGSRVAHGRTASGRYLKVVYVRDPKPDSVFVASFRQVGMKQGFEECWSTTSGRLRMRRSRKMKPHSNREAKPSWSFPNGWFRISRDSSSGVAL